MTLLFIIFGIATLTSSSLDYLAQGLTIHSASSPDGLRLERGNTSVITNVRTGMILRTNRQISFAYSLQNPLPRESQWLLSSDGTTTIRSVAFNTCLDESFSIGFSPTLRSCSSGNLGQQWRLVDSADGTFKRIQSMQSELYLDQLDMDINSFPELVEFNASDSQLWLLVPSQDSSARGFGRLQMPWPDFPENKSMVWPNNDSRANTDPFLKANHNSISQLRPRVLVISPLNEYTAEDVLAKAQNLAIAFAQGSRYHGYKAADALLFLRYIIDRVVLVNDNSTSPLEARSWASFGDAYYPRPFFEPDFADYIGYPSSDGSRNLTMCELFQQGVINEVWFAGWSAEFLSYAPQYTAQLGRRVSTTCAGNGCLTNASAVDYCNVTVRLMGLTMDRGLGCSLHNQGHGIEGLQGVNQYLRHQGQRFFNDGLRRDNAAPFDSLYSLPPFIPSCPNPLTYVNSSSVTVNYYKSQPQNRSAACGDATVTLTDVWKGCGNTHFAPNSRFEYDADRYRLIDATYGDAAGAVLNTCENYGLRNGINGQDALTEYSYFTTNVSLYDLQGFSDCEGGWSIYMRQNMPGFQNRAIQEGSADLPEPYMRNWWPFLFY